MYLENLNLFQIRSHPGLCLAQNLKDKLIFQLGLYGGTKKT
jgi:hypothetical protein